jgi:hypothetical protein
MELFIVLLVVVLCWFLFCEELSDHLNSKYPTKADMVTFMCLLLFWSGIIGLVSLYMEIYKWWIS